MTPSAERFLRWAPRLLCLVFAVFVGMFALDAFEPGRGFGENLIHFAIHLIPTYVILGLLIVGWRWPKVAGALFIVGGFWYSLRSGVRPHLSWIVVVSGPAWVTGALFLMSSARKPTVPATR